VTGSDDRAAGLTPAAAPEALVFRSNSVEDTEALGVALAPELAPGDLVALTGPLGAGKTRFVTGLAHGMSCRGRVRSPSFTLVNEYPGRILLLHLDLYRIDARDVDGLGIEESLTRGALVVEWGEKLPGWARADALALAFAAPSEFVRVVTAHAGTGRGAALLAGWASRVAADGRA
jgi:tRNA threonylcarbamoyladenosine biosynthesis protein TsaE